MKATTLLLVGVLLLATLLVNSANSANILVIAFWSSKSHKITYMPLVEELGKRGHNMTVVTPIKPMKELKNVNEIFTMDVESIFHSKQFNPFEMKEKGMDPATWMNANFQVCNESLDLPQVRSLLKERFDLVITQPIFNECALGIVYRLQAPFIIFSPMVAPNWIVGNVGGHLPPSFIPHFMLPYPQEMTFPQRFINMGVDMVLGLFADWFQNPRMEKLYREKLGSDIPSVPDILANASLVISNGHFSLSGPRPYLPDVVNVGGIHARPAKPIPKDLEDFIGKGKEGFILFSMGSVIKADMMPEVKRKLLVNVFSKLKQQILWKWDSETMPDLPKNVKLSKWLPQEDLLGHKDIKMFITHCGGGSTEESIYHGVPLVGIPMLGDQLQNADLAKKHDFIVGLEWNDLTEDGLMEAIQEVLNNPKYRENVQRLSTLFKDRPIDPMKEGVYWIEYILRHNGAYHLRSAGRKLNAFQYHSYDVIGAYLAIIGVALYVIFKTLRFVCRKVFCRFGKSSKKTVASGKKVN